MITLPRSLVNALHGLMLAAAALLLVFHAVHLAADFPNNSPWMDWSKYTDEGWYGDAAIRHFELGHWYVAGDFNPAAALPVWPLLEAIVFRFTGVSLVAARALTVAVFGGILVSSWFLLRRWRIRPLAQAPLAGIPPAGSSLAASAAVLLLAASPFCFVFTRLAILEPLLTLLTLLALLAASAARVPLSGAGTLATNRLPMLALSLLLPALVLTKTTGLFLVPAVAWLLFATLDYKPRLFLRTALPPAALGMVLWLGWYALVVRPHYLLDYRYLFSANAYTGITRDTFVSVLVDTLRDGLWMGRIVYPCALAAGVWALVRFRRLVRHPLIPALLLWIGGYTSFLAYHDNLQPRYYLVIAVPLTLLLPVVLEQLVLPAFHTERVTRLAFAVSALLVSAIVLPDARQTIHYARHPDYTLLDAAHEISAYIAEDRRADPTHNPLVLSISGSDLSLMTGLPSICDDFGTLELAARVERYRPGWYAAWNQIDDDKMDAMTPLYHIERVAAFPAMDDPDRNLLILYKLEPSIVTPAIKRKKTPTPRRLQTRVGQQPSVNQLEH